MTVAFDATSEKPTGTQGDTSSSSFSWTHTPSGAPKGLLIFVIQRQNGDVDKVTSVTYGGTAVPAVSGGAAFETSGSTRKSCRAYFLGSALPTGAQTVVVNRVNDTTEMWAVANTVTAAQDTEVDLTSIFLQQGSSVALSEQSVDDGSFGVDSLRFAGLSSGLATTPSPGANSTACNVIDMGSATASVVRETAAGQGPRTLGWSATADHVAAVYLDVREPSFGNITVAPGHIQLTGQPIVVSTVVPVTPGHIDIVGQNLIVIAAGRVTIPVTLPGATTWSDASTLWSDPSTTWSDQGGTSMLLEGGDVQHITKVPVTPGAVALQGQSGFTFTRTIPVTPGQVTLQGQNVAVSGATTFLVELGHMTLQGSDVAVSWKVPVTPANMGLAGLLVALSYRLPVTPGNMSLNGGSFDISTHVGEDVEPTPDWGADESRRPGLTRQLVN